MNIIQLVLTMKHESFAPVYTGIFPEGPLPRQIFGLRKKMSQKWIPRNSCFKMF
jgi:hypothetical protein